MYNKQFIKLVALYGDDISLSSLYLHSPSALYTLTHAREVMRRQHHLIKWEEVRVVDRASKNYELKIKVALHIQMTPDNNKFNRDIGLELPGCWLSMLHANHPPGHNKQ